MKKIWLPLLAVLLLCACGGENDRAEELQEQYQQVSSYETDVRVCVPREDETIAYCLHLSAQGDTVRAEVKEPQELAGVGAVLEGERLSLTFDGLVLDVGTLSPRVSALNCAPMLLRAFPKAHLDSFGTETLGGEIVLHVDFSLSSGSEKLFCSLYFDDAGAPVYAEIAEMKKLLRRQSLRILFLVIYYRQTQRSSARSDLKQKGGSVYGKHAQTDLGGDRP